MSQPYLLLADKLNYTIFHTLTVQNFIYRRAMELEEHISTRQGLHNLRKILNWFKNPKMIIQGSWSSGLLTLSFTHVRLTEVVIPGTVITVYCSFDIFDFKNRTRYTATIMVLKSTKYTMDTFRPMWTEGNKTQWICATKGKRNILHKFIL